MEAIEAVAQAMRGEESGASLDIQDEVLNALAVAIVLTIECKEIEGLSAEWAS